MRYGHLKLSRKLFDGADPFWQEPRVFSRFEAWVDLIQMAAWRATVYSTAHGDDQLARGELVASLRFLATRWGWGKNVVSRFFDYLEKAGRIAGQRTGHHGRVYLIVNYSEYQRTPNERGTEDGTGAGTPAGQGRDSNGTEAGQRRRQLSSETAAASPMRTHARAALDEAIGPDLTARFEAVVTERSGAGVAREHLRTALAVASGMEPPHLTNAQLAEAIAEYLDKARQPTIGFFRGFLRTAKERADRPPPEPARATAGAGSPIGRSGAPTDRAARAGANALAAALAMNGRTAATTPSEDPT